MLSGADRGSKGGKYPCFSTNQKEREAVLPVVSLGTVEASKIKSFIVYQI
jgi:hypothetical protein